MSSIKIERALISVSDKTGVEKIARALVEHKVEILSTGGTARLLTEKEIPVTSVDQYTGHPEIMNGRVKTLHPKVHGGILAVRSDESHRKQMQEHGISPIDMVIVNLYPFEQTIAKPDVALEDAIENIDIGGPTMVRSSAKNHAFVTIVVDPSDYDALIDELNGNGAISLETRQRLAWKAFKHTSLYDTAIAAYLSKQYNVS